MINEDIFTKLNITARQMKVCFAACIAMFAMVTLQYLGVHSPINIYKMAAILSPLVKGNNVAQAIQTKLEEKQNSFILTKTALSQRTLDDQSADFNKAAAYSLINLNTGAIIAEKNGTKRLPIASLTKIMSSIVALDLSSPNDMFTITPFAATMPPTKIGVVPGQRMSLQELLNAALLTSANDAMEEIRDGVNAQYHGNIFVNAMNEKAAFLGLTNTHFTTPQGFDYKNNYSSAEDLSTLIHYALTNYPLIADIVKKDYTYLPANKNHKQFDLYNWNGLLGVYPDTVGVKIGNTPDAGYTNAVLSTRGGEQLLAVILGAPNLLSRDLWTSELLDYGYRETINLPPVNITADQLYAKYATWKYWN
jgi:D-alanyl-D-alanine carboxypeptidase